MRFLACLSNVPNNCLTLIRLETGRDLPSLSLSQQKFLLGTGMGFMLRADNMLELTIYMGA